ncbi:methyltransferase domain-containing protein [Candidatus Villigracilis affinis]|uniref:class I SAM-dependent methyltransferase n=1 Tax=Candidatus Villigracilis affinis TaxID=3140682 RepID=UPI0031E64371
MTALYIILGLIAIGVIASLIWRRDSLPCPSWLAWMVEMDNPFTEVNRARVIVGLLELAPGMRVLDAGCGPGRLTLPLAETVGPLGEVTALDIQDEMLARVRRKVETVGFQNVKFLHAGLGEGKLPQAYFDRALLVTVFGEIPDQESALEEIYKALKPGGVLSVTEVIFDPHFHRRETVLKVAQAPGFKEKNFFGKKLAYTMHLEK